MNYIHVYRGGRSGSRGCGGDYRASCNEAADGLSLFFSFNLEGEDGVVRCARVDKVRDIISW